MRKLLLATLFVAATAAFAQAQEIQNMGRAPSEPNGIGRLDARVVDEAGNPVKGVRLKLESRRSDGYRCESWNWTDDRGVAVLPPIHMGQLRLVVKAKVRRSEARHQPRQPLRTRPHHARQRLTAAAEFHNEPTADRDAAEATGARRAGDSTRAAAPVFRLEAARPFRFGSSQLASRLRSAPCQSASRRRGAPSAAAAPSARRADAGPAAR